MTNLIAMIVLAATAAVFAFLIPFAIHRSYLLVLASRARDEIRDPWPEEDLPRVTVQLPMYNERAVAVRVIDAAAQLDYPSALLEIQVLDDSDDITVSLVAERVAWWGARGVEIEQIRRDARTGYTAGALSEGVARSRGEFLFVLDADFVPSPDTLRDLLMPMQDPEVGMVQAAWSHLNRFTNWLTESQGFLLDGHFLYEQGGRYRGGRFFNFNGTAGLWRRSCLEDAGGWQSDTLTEDLDLSYRAQMAGWRFAYLDDVQVPAEIPDSVMALELQQRRWAQGGVQTGRKVLPALLRGPFPFAVKTEAVIHLFGHMAHPLTWLLALLLFPSAIARRALGLDHLLGLDLFLFGAATVPFILFYWMAGEEREVARRGRFRSVLRTLAMGIGLSVPVTHAVLRGLRGTEDAFERTPKRGSSGVASYAAAVPLPFGTIAKISMAFLMTGYLLGAIAGGYWGQLPFIVLFLSGYMALGLPVLQSHISRRLSSIRLPGIENKKDEKRYPEGHASADGLHPIPGVSICSKAVVADECEAA
jgi:cellulose synthase/poly-beta-1,6-N-acetylglucosamine synthase-like glycosyltransferase